MIEYKSGKNIIEFDDRPKARQRYKLNGDKVPGVTTFIKNGYPTSSGLINWKILQAAEYVYDLVKEDTVAKKEDILTQCLKVPDVKAQEEADIGIILHDYAHLSGLNKDEEALEFIAQYEGSKDWDRILNAISKFDEFNKQNNDEIIHLENAAASLRYAFAGRFDRLAKRGKLLILTDYKTSKRFYPEQFIQDGAYSIAIKEWFNLDVTGYEVIRFGKNEGDNEFDPLLITDPSDLKMFQEQALRCRDTYEWVKSIGRDKRFK